MRVFPGSPETWAVLVVKLKRKEEEAPQMLAALEQLGIAADVLPPDDGSRQPSDVVLHIPQARLSEALLALEFHGFLEVRAYDAQGGNERT